jgi:hypothetical protein
MKRNFFVGCQCGKYFDWSSKFVVGEDVFVCVCCECILLFSSLFIHIRGNHTVHSIYVAINSSVFAVIGLL